MDTTTTEVMALLADAKLAATEGFEKVARINLRDALRLARGSRDTMVRAAIKDAKQVVAFAE